MAIVVLVLWMFTAGAGFYLLVTSNLGRARPADAFMAARHAPAGQRAAAPVATRAVQTAAASPGQSVSDPAQGVPQAAPATHTGQAASDVSPPHAAPPVSKREMRRAARDRFDPPSLTAAKSAPVVPGLRSLLEFAHPASAIVGLGFWLGYTLVHYRALGWIAFGMVTVTVGLGLSWFAASTRAARSREAANHDNAAGHTSDDEPGPSFSFRLIGLHGAAAAVTFALAALTVFVLR